MLVITRRAKEKLQEIAEEAPIGGVGDAAFGVRIVLTDPDSDIQGNNCKIGIGQAQIGDLTIDIGGKKLFIDPATLTCLHHTSAILDLTQRRSREDLVLIVEGPNYSHWAASYPKRKVRAT